MNPDREFGPLQPSFRVGVAFLVFAIVALAIEGYWLILGIQLAVLAAGFAIGVFRSVKR